MKTYITLSSNLPMIRANSFKTPFNALIEYRKRRNKKNKAAKQARKRQRGK